MHENDPETPTFVLICGCPRSGTTELVSLLNKHGDVYLGCERYVHRFYDVGEPVTPAHFSPQRFRELRPGDTFWRSLDDMPGWAGNGQAEPGISKQGRTRFYGDKVPDLVFHLRRVLPPFQGRPKILTCVRDLLSVARSWQARADNAADDLWERDSGFEQAIIHWTGALAAMVDDMADGLPVLDVYSPYLYDPSGRETQRIVDFLELPADAGFQAAVAAKTRWEQGNPDVRPGRQRQPSAAERELIRGHAYVRTTVAKLRDRNYRIPLDTLFWPGFTAEGLA